MEVFKVEIPLSGLAKPSSAVIRIDIDKHLQGIGERILIGLKEFLEVQFSLEVEWESASTGGRMTICQFTLTRSPNSVVALPLNKALHEVSYINSLTSSSFNESGYNFVTAFRPTYPRVPPSEPLSPSSLLLMSSPSFRTFPPHLLTTSGHPNSTDRIDFSNPPHSQPLLFMSGPLGNQSPDLRRT
jgi:hypothetical protein